MPSLILESLVGSAQNISNMVVYTLESAECPLRLPAWLHVDAMSHSQVISRSRTQHTKQVTKRDSLGGRSYIGGICRSPSIT